MVVSVPSVSREYIRVPITAIGTDVATLIALPVKFAFMNTRSAEPITNDFVNGSWEPNQFPAQARCLIGPGGAKVLTSGTYYVWVEVVGAVEQPMRQVGTLIIT